MCLINKCINTYWNLISAFTVKEMIMHIIYFDVYLYSDLNINICVLFLATRESILIGKILAIY